MAGVIQGDPERPGALQGQPEEMVRLTGRAAPLGALEFAANGAACVVAVVVAQVLGFLDVGRFDWIDAALGAGVVLAACGTTAMRLVPALTDRLDAAEPVAPEVALDEHEPGASRLRWVGGQMLRWLGWTALVTGCLAAADQLDGGWWPILIVALFLGGRIRREVTRRLTAAHEEAEGVRIYQPEDEDEWYEDATGKELGEHDPGPLFQRPARPD